jgi:RNA polymerase sigma-70 factor (ECF subfamily)
MESAHNEKELLRCSAEGNEAAFASLFRIYRHKLYGFLLRATGSPETAEDVIQDVFLKLWKDRTALLHIEQFGGYVYRMAQNRVINSLKRMAKETLILEELRLAQSPAASGTEERLAEKETRHHLHSALNKLSPKQKLVFTLSREQGLKHDEIAAFLKISPSTVNNHMIEALRQLRQQMSTSPEACTLLLIALVFLP